MSHTPITRHIALIVLLTFCAIVVRVTAQKPLNPCDLIKVADLPAVAGKAKIQSFAPGKPDAVGVVSCDYQWGPGNNTASGRYTLDIAVADSARLWPGLGPAQLRMMVGPAKAGTSGDIAGVGDASLWQVMSDAELKTITLVKSKSLIITLEGRDAPQRKDGLIALTTLAVSKLQQ